MSWMNFMVITTLFVIFCNGQEMEEVARLASYISAEQTKALNYQMPKNSYGFYEKPKSEEVTFFDQFDFIIVGSGSSGSILAHRLSENENWRILLLEAGGEETEFSDIPSEMWFTHLSPMNWGYNTTSQTTCCLGMINHQCPYPRGRVIGGSSTINAMMYVRGNKKDYDKWETLGNKGWSYEDVLPFFKKSENFTLPYQSQYYHGTRGNLTVDRIKPLSKIATESFSEANEEIGQHWVDYNGRTQEGWSVLQMNTRNGRRVSGGRAFLDPIRDRKNLVIIENALVTKVSLEGTTARGVVFVRNGSYFSATVSREVILSTGSINTPQIMILSGLGPKEDLKNLNIPAIVHLPAVGKNLQDHFSFFGLSFRTNYTISLNATQSIIDYLNGYGLLTYGSNTQALGFVNTLNKNCSVPNIEYILIPQPNRGPTAQSMTNANEETMKYFINNINPLTDFRIFVVLLHPISAGKVYLKSNDPFEFPEVDINYFSDPANHDIETMYQGIQYVLDLTKQEAFRKFNTSLALDYPPCRGKYPLPNDSKNEFSSESESDFGSKEGGSEESEEEASEERKSKTDSDRQYWYCVIRHLSNTLYHPIGTTRMGRSPKDSVVSDELKVHGVGKLRIADAGVIPHTISGHTSAPAFMIGEKLAHMIKKDYGALKDNELDF